MDALYQPGCGLDVETAAGSNGDTTQVVACLFAGRHDHTHQVPGPNPAEHQADFSSRGLFQDP